MDYLDKNKNSAIADTVISALLSLVPPLGGALSNVYSGIRQYHQSQKVITFINQLAKDIKSIKSKLPPIENYDIDALNSITEEIFEKVKREYSNEKIKYFKTYAKNTLINPIVEKNFDIRKFFLEVLTSITILECNILIKLYNLEKPIAINDIPKSKDISSFAIIGFTERLSSYGFLKVFPQEITFGGKEDRRGTKIVKISDFGKEFYEFCLMS